MSTKNKTVWITGASSGLGLHTAGALRKNGYRVIAGARSFSDVQKRTDENCLPLDVTDESSVSAFCAAALERSGSPDILINCAGVLVLGACETYQTDEIRRVMETNFFGTVRMIQKVLPLMREKGKGRIVNFSSINGLLGVPFEGAYTASKHAIEGFTECLAMEVRPLGIETMLVEPGDHKSGSGAYRFKSRGMTEKNPYLAAFEKGTAAIARDEKNGSDPDILGEKIAKALARKRLPGRLCVAKADQRLAVALHDLLPPRVFSAILSSYYVPSMKGDHHAKPER